MGWRKTLGFDTEDIPAMNAAPQVTWSLLATTKAIAERIGSAPVDDDNLNSILDLQRRTSGRIVVKTATLTVATGANIAYNLFSFTGPFYMHSFGGIITDVTDITDFDDVGFDVYDGTNSVPLSVRNPSGTNLTGYGLYSGFSLNEDVSAAFTALNSDQVRIDQPSGRTAFLATLIVPKQGVTNYIRLLYDCSTSINVTLVVGCSFVDFGSGQAGGLQPA